MINFEEFVEKLNNNNREELTKFKLTEKWLYNECAEYIQDEKIIEYDVNKISTKVINEYIDELLYRHNRKFDYDRE